MQLRHRLRRHFINWRNNTIRTLPHPNQAIRHEMKPIPNLSRSTKLMLLLVKKKRNYSMMILGELREEIAIKQIRHGLIHMMHRETEEQIHTQRTRRTCEVTTVQNHMTRLDRIIIVRSMGLIRMVHIVTKEVSGILLIGKTGYRVRHPLVIIESSSVSSKDLTEVLVVNSVKVRIHTSTNNDLDMMASPKKTSRFQRI